jgi:outer membrane protein OmpA-like peptidoglycan-associated protein
MTSAARVRAAAAVALVLVLAAACGGSDEPIVFPTTVAVDSGDGGVILPSQRTTTSTTEEEKAKPSSLSPITAAVLRALGAVQTTEGVSVPVAGDVLFDSGSATLRAEATKIVDQLSGAAKELPTARIRITGHTDDQGGVAYNQTLSEHRAQAMADALRSKDASLGPRLDVLGKGETQPVAPNTTPEGRQKNRRVEILFVGAKL